MNGINNLENMLYNTIVAWYDNELIEYHGLDDPDFEEKVCGVTGMTKSDYSALISGNSRECSWNK